VFVTKLFGPVDLPAFQQEHGGGVFRFVSRNAQGQLNGSPIKVELAGPLRNFRESPTVSTALAPVDHAGRRERMLLRRMMRRLERMEMRLNAPTAAPAAASPPMSFESMFALAERIADRGRGESPVDQVVNALLRGIDLGQQREPVPASNEPEWMPIVKEFAPVLRDLLGALARSSAARPRPGAPPPPATDSRAVVVEAAPVSPGPAAAPAPAPAPGAEAVSYRWLTAVDSLVEAIHNDEDPADWSVSLEAILPPADVFALKAATTEQVLERLAPAALTYPVLKTEQARLFVDAVLAELRKKPSADVE
jgi:hypothetical protein